MTVHAIHVHTNPEPESVGTFIELAAWAERKINDYLEDIGEGEIAQSIGARGRERSAARIALLEDLRLLIRDAVAAEGGIDAQESVEPQYKDLDPIEDALEIRRLAGDR